MTLFDPDAAVRKAVRQFLEAFEAEIMAALSKGKRAEVKALAVCITGGKLGDESHVEPARVRPLEKRA